MAAFFTFVINLFITIVLSHDTKDFYAKCSYFENNGAVYMELQALAGMFLRGQDCLVSSNQALMQKTLNSWHNELYDALTDDFQIENMDSESGGILIQNKQQFVGNRGPYMFINKIREKGSVTIESFPVFECIERNGQIEMDMSFNVLEYQGSKTIAYNGKIIFEYIHVAHRFMIKKYQYGEF